MAPDTESWGESLDNTMLIEPWSESHDRIEIEQDPFSPSYDQLPWPQDLESLLPDETASPEFSGGGNYLPPTEPMLDANVPQGLLERSQTFVQASQLEIPAPALTMHPASQPWPFLRNQEETVPEHIRQEKERRERHLAILQNKQAMLEAERDLIAFKITHGLSGSSHVNPQIRPALLPPQSQMHSHPPQRTMSFMDSNPQNFAPDSNDWPMTSEHSVTFDQWGSASGGSSTANQIPRNAETTTVMPPDILFGDSGPDTEDGVTQLPLRSSPLAQQLLPSSQLLPDTRICQPPPPESAIISNGATMALVERKRKPSFGRLAAEEAARLMKRICTTKGSIAPSITVFSCSAVWTRPSKKKTPEQLTNGRKVRAKGGQCILCWMMKKPCSGERPCQRCRQYAARSTSYQWTCNVRTKWTTFSDLFHPGSSAMSVAQASKAFAAAVAKLKNIPADVLDVFAAIYGTRPENFSLWLEIYEQRLAKKWGLDGQRQGRLVRVISATDVESLLPIFFVLSHLALPYSWFTDTAGNSLLATLEDMRRCSAAMMLERAERAHIGQADPVEGLTILALVDAQRRYSCWLDWKALPGEEKERHQYLGSATATHLRHLASRIQQRNDNLAFTRSGRSITWSGFLEDVEENYSREVQKWPRSHYANLATLVFEYVAISACAGNNLTITNGRNAVAT